MSQLKTNSIVDASGGNTATINGVVPNAFNVRGKNKIINGNFDVWQRGTGAFTTNSAYSADRFSQQLNGSTLSVSQSSFAIGQTDVPNEPKHYLTAAVTTSVGAGNYALVQHKIESVRTLAGQNATLSFWAKADASKDIAIEIGQYFGTGGSPSPQNTTVSNTTVSLTTSWQKFEIQASVDSISGKTLGTDNNDYLYVFFWLDAGSDFNTRTNSLGNQSGTFDIAQVQLEAGDTASGFEHLSYGETLAMCQRYYELCGGISATAYNITNNGISGNYSYNVAKRAPATLNTVVVPDFSNTYNLTGVASTTTGFGYFCLVTSGGSASFGLVTSGVIAADAEL